MILARSAADTGRPRASSASAIVGTASASTALVRDDHAVMSSSGTPAISAWPCSDTGPNDTGNRADSSARSAVW